MLSFRHISKANMTPLVLQCSQTAQWRKCSCTLHVSHTLLSRKPKPIIHIEFCLGKLASTLENKQPETRKLHLYGGETLMSCGVMAVLPCRHIAKASLLSGALHGNKWFSIFPDSKQNGSMKCATPWEMKHCTFIKGGNINHATVEMFLPGELFSRDLALSRNFSWLLYSDEFSYPTGNHDQL